MGHMHPMACKLHTFKNKTWHYSHINQNVEI